MKNHLLNIKTNQAISNRFNFKKFSKIGEYPTVINTKKIIISKINKGNHKYPEIYKS